MLTFIKSTHSLIWLFFNIVLGIMFYEVITDKITTLFWFGNALIAAEFLVLVIYRWKCPLSVIARKYSKSQKENFDIFLPLWIARHNKSIYSILFLLIWGIFIFNKI